MPHSDNNLTATEMQMRQALGLNRTSRLAQNQTTSLPPSRRFVRDGKVPVVVVQGGRERGGGPVMSSRLAELELALEAERAAHADDKRSLEEFRQAIHSLQTRLIHSELAFAEALMVEQNARAIAEAALAEAASKQTEAVSIKPSSHLAARPPRNIKPEAKSATKVPRPKLVKWWAPKGAAAS